MSWTGCCWRKNTRYEVSPGSAAVKGHTLYNSIYMTYPGGKSRGTEKTVCGCQGLRDWGERDEEWLLTGSWGFFGVRRMFWNLIEVVFSWHCGSTKCRFKMVNCFVIWFSPHFFNVKKRRRFLVSALSLLNLVTPFWICFLIYLTSTWLLGNRYRNR